MNSKSSKVESGMEDASTCFEDAKASKEKFLYPQSTAIPRIKRASSTDVYGRIGIAVLFIVAKSDVLPKA